MDLCFYSANINLASEIAKLFIYTCGLYGVHFVSSVRMAAIMKMRIILDEWQYSDRQMYKEGDIGC